jgi:hypothetical protein
VYKICGALQSGFIIDGEVRDIKMIKTITGKKMIAVARNNNTIRMFSLPANNGIELKK